MGKERLPVVDRKTELLLMDVMAEDTLWRDGPVIENQWATMGFAA